MSFRDACARALRALSSRLARRRAVADWYLRTVPEEERTAVFASRDAEPCRKFSAKGGDGQQRGRSGADVPEAFFLPFIGEEHADIPFPVQPFPDLAFRQFTAHFLHHEVPRLKAAQGIVMDGNGRNPSSPAAFSGGEVRMHTFPRSLQKGAVITRSPGLSSPAGFPRPRLPSV